MERKIDGFLESWYTRRERLPLLLFGARQTGKTYAVKKFASKRFTNLVYLNFEENSALCSLFDEKIDAATVIRNIELYASKQIDPAHTLIFLDEIQLCERALTALKYLAEEAAEYPVIASGSLLGVMINRTRHSFPVGKVTFKKLQPLDFEEFLWAMDQRMLSEAILEAYSKLEPLPEPIHCNALEWMDLYLYLGGMPAVLNAFLSDRQSDGPNGNFELADEKKTDLLTAYLADMSKYASSTESNRIMAAFNSIPAQFAKENHKFQYRLIQKGASSTLFGPSLEWLENAGLINRCYRLNQPVFPLSGNQDIGAFKVYLHDTGLLARLLGASPGEILLPKLDGNTRGAVTENYVAAALLKNFEDIYYWEYKSQAEVDFIVQMKNSAVPIEVKSGGSVKSKSLRSYCNRFSPETAIRFSRRHFGKTNHIVSLPLYAVFCLSSR